VKARFVSTVEVELKEALEFYEVAEAGLGARFLNEVNACVDRVVANTLA
jgi:hypothetical protein